LFSFIFNKTNPYSCSAVQVIIISVMYCLQDCPCISQLWALSHNFIYIQATTPPDHI